MKREPQPPVVPCAACDRCARAVKRLVAAIGGDGRVVQATAPPSVAPIPMPAAVQQQHTPPQPPVLRAEVLLVYAETLITPDSTSYVVRACGTPRADGMWVGWLEFTAAGESTVRRTGQETTQPNRDALLYWASGLEPVYLQGAFARAG